MGKGISWQGRKQWESPEATTDVAGSRKSKKQYGGKGVSERVMTLEKQPQAEKYGPRKT